MLTCCTECNHKFEVSDDQVFQIISCKHCHKEFRALWYVKPTSKTLDITSQEESESLEEQKTVERDTPKRTRKTMKQIIAEKTAFMRDEFAKIMPKISEAIERNENESGTRLIVDQILQNILGYKLEDIQTERKIQGKKADYVLSIKDKDVLVVEAKAVNRPLKAKQIFQATSYGARSGIKWTVLTNAAVWQLYRILTEEKVEAKLVFTIDLREGLNDGNLQYFYLLSKHGIGREHLLQKLWEKTRVLSTDNLMNAILTDGVISKLRTTLSKETGCKLTNEQLFGEQAPIYSNSLRKRISPVFQSHITSRCVNWGAAL